jgi:hypothetical protein
VLVGHFPPPVTILTARLYTDARRGKESARVELPAGAAGVPLPVAGVDRVVEVNRTGSFPSQCRHGWMTQPNSSRLADRISGRTDASYRHRCAAEAGRSTEPCGQGWLDQVRWAARWSRRVAYPRSPDGLAHRE